MWLAPTNLPLRQKAQPHAEQQKPMKNMNMNTVFPQPTEPETAPKKYWALQKNEAFEFSVFHEVMVIATSKTRAIDKASTLPEAKHFPISVCCVDAEAVEGLIACAEEHRAKLVNSDARVFFCIVQDVSDDTFTLDFVITPNIREASRKAIDRRKKEHSQQNVVADDCGFVVAMVFDLPDLQGLLKQLASTNPSGSKAGTVQISPG